jgi:aryl-alcohol dehydrogenase-like predicted oxidoreductase
VGERLFEAAEISRKHGFAEFAVLQNRYNLVDREPYESDSAPALAELGMSCVPFYGIALGFLTGKYQPGVELKTARSEGAKQYFTESNWATLAKVTKLASELRAQPTVGVPIASARNVEQLAELMQHVDLTEEQLALLA